MEYRIYVDYLKGPTCLGTHNAKRTIMILDELMCDERFKTISVVGEDKENNMDIPVFSYHGFNTEEYVEFRQKLIEENQIKKYVKRI